MEINIDYDREEWKRYSKTPTNSAGESSGKNEKLLHCTVQMMDNAHVVECPYQGKRMRRHYESCHLRIRSARWRDLHMCLLTLYIQTLQVHLVLPHVHAKVKRTAAFNHPVRAQIWSQYRYSIYIAAHVNSLGYAIIARTHFGIQANEHVI